MLKSAFAGAITYMHNRGNVLRSFLDNPYLQPDKGTSEHALRPITIGRDNWMFIGSEKGGKATGEADKPSPELPRHGHQRSEIS